MRALMAGTFDIEYHETCRRTVDGLTAIGLEGRGRLLYAAQFLSRAFELLAAKHRFSGATAAERGKVLMRALLCDIATTSTLALRAQGTARRGAAA